MDAYWTLLDAMEKPMMAEGVVYMSNRTPALPSGRGGPLNGPGRGGP